MLRQKPHVQSKPRAEGLQHLQYHLYSKLGDSLILTRHCCSAVQRIIVYNKYRCGFCMYTVLEDGSRGVCGSTAAGAHGARPGLISASCVFPRPWRDRSALNRQVRAVKTKIVFSVLPSQHLRRLLGLHVLPPCAVLHVLHGLLKARCARYRSTLIFDKRKRPPKKKRKRKKKKKRKKDLTTGGRKRTTDHA